MRISGMIGFAAVAVALALSSCASTDQQGGDYGSFPRIDPNRAYYIISLDNGQRIASFARGPAAETEKVGVARSGTSERARWRFTRNSDGSYSIENIDAHKFLDVQGGIINVPGRDAVVFADSSARWRIESVQGGFRFVPQGEWMPLSIRGSESSEGTGLITLPWMGMSFQIWRLVPAPDVSTPSAPAVPKLVDAEPKAVTNGDQTAQGSGKLGSLAGKKIAVVGVSVSDQDLAKDTPVTVQNFLIHAFVTYSSSVVVDRDSVDKIMKEHEFQSNAVADSSTAVEVGKLVGADAIVVGTLSKSGSRYYLAVKVVSVATGEILASAVGDSTDESGFLDMCIASVKSM
jgi:hypothetical protein